MKVQIHMDKDDMEEIIQHFTHPKHPLKLVQLVAREGIFPCHYTCYCCGYKYKFDLDHGSSSGAVMYACIENCNTCDEITGYGTLFSSMTREGYLCAVCARLDISMERPDLFPRHPRLKLVDNRLVRSVAKGRECGACSKYITFGDNFTYHCGHDECDFELHVQCAHSLKPTLSLSHDHECSCSHLLTLVDYNNSDRVLNCESCHSIIERVSSFARCIPCNLNYHINCDRPYFSLPKLIMCPQGHPQHPLSRVHNKSYRSCDVCHKKINWPANFSVYSCLECNNFTAHFSCIFQSSLPCPSSNLVNNVVLDDLRIKDGPVHGTALCQGCKRRALSAGLPVFGCQCCNFYLHESCIRQWSQQPTVEDKKDKLLIFGHPGYDFQHNEPHVLVFAHGEEFKCDCCKRKCSGFMFQDKSRNGVFLDLECMLLVPSLEVFGHDHPAILLQRSNATKSSYLRCVQCDKDFSIIKSSCRFPHTLLNESHFHPLTLMPHLTENDDIEQCYCDVCEDKRDSTECIYYCEECNFEVHMGCVKTTVLALCANKPKDVNFATLEEITQEEKAKKKKNIRHVFHLEKELQHSYAYVEDEFDNIFQAASKTTWNDIVDENLSYNDKFLNKTLYSDRPFKQFVEEVISTSALKKTRSTLESLRKEEVVRSGKYLVPTDFEEVLETLFDKYGDFGGKCTCSLEAKQYLFVGLCKALRSMCNTKIAHVSKNSLVEWWTWFIIGKAAGFRVHFALRTWERIVYAYFGLEADKYANGELTRVRKKISEVPEEMKELRRKLEKLTRELNGKERELEEAITEEKELRESAFRVKKSHLMRKCLKEAEDLACYSGGELLLPPSEEACDSA